MEIFTEEEEEEDEDEANDGEFELLFNCASSFFDIFWIGD